VLDQVHRHRAGYPAVTLAVTVTLAAVALAAVTPAGRRLTAPDATVT
jgi:hypothetical protein